MSLKRYPIISVRDLVVFPRARSVIMTGRPFTQETILQAIKEHQSLLVVSTQKRLEQNEKPTKEDIFETGTMCKIEKKVLFSDGFQKILLQGLYPVEIEGLEDCDNLRFAQVKERVEKNADQKIDFQTITHFLDLLYLWKPKFKDERYKEHFELLKKSKKLSQFLGGILSHIAASNIPTPTNIQNEILSENESDQKIMKQINRLAESRIEILRQGCWLERQRHIENLLKREIVET